MSRDFSDEDISRFARRFIQQHGQAAIELLTNKEHEELIGGNVTAAGTCRRIRREIERRLSAELISLSVH